MIYSERATTVLDYPSTNGGVGRLVEMIWRKKCVAGTWLPTPPSCILIPYNYTTAFDICIGIYFLLPMFMVLHGLYIYNYNNYIVCSCTWYTLNNMGLCLCRLNQKCMPAGHTCIHNN